MATDTAADAAEGRRARDDVWVAAEEGDMSEASAGRPLLFRTMKVKGSILHPYRSVCAARHSSLSACMLFSYVPLQF